MTPEEMSIVPEFIIRKETSKMMNEAYDILRELTIEELQECIDRASYEFTNDFNRGVYDEYRDAFAAECLFVHQCRETIRRKQMRDW